MAAEITYYAILHDGRTVDSPSGLARRVRDEEGVADEALHADMKWHGTGTIARWEHAEYSGELVEITEADARRAMEHIRERWRDAGVLEEDA